MEHILLLSITAGLLIHTASTKSTLLKTEKNAEYLSQQITLLKQEQKEFTLFKYLLNIERATEKIRALYAHTPIEYKFISKHELTQFLSKKFEQVYPEETFKDIERSMKTIGLIDDTVNLKAVLLALYQEQIAAFYDYHEKKLYYVKNSFFTPNNKKMFISHEIVHALQDQNFDLVTLGIEDKTNDDSVSALSALCEGDAMYCMSEYYKSNINAGLVLDLVSGIFALYKQEQFANAPPFIKENMLFPYEYGTIFVSYFYQEGNTESVDNLFRNPPKSTEQILHPEKYSAGETPLFPLFSDYANAFNDHNLRIMNTNVLGEFSLGLLLKQYMPEPIALNAAEGWGSDHFIVFEDQESKETGFILISLWDSQKDAEEFFDAYSTWAKRKHNIANQATAQDQNTFDVVVQLTHETNEKKRLKLYRSQSFCCIIYASGRHLPFLEEIADTAKLNFSSSD